MNISGRISFWAEGVNCFCHEALSRALHEAFGAVEIDPVDIALQKYESEAKASEKIESSAWYRYLRMGPCHRFTLPSGITGFLRRYRIDFEIPDHMPIEDVERVRSFLKGLKFREIEVKENE